MCKSKLFRCGFVALLLMFGLPAAAKTPEGQTPAQANLCDKLKEEGAPKGLYGLCVALCEAQGFSGEPTKQSHEKLRANYNKLSKGDPEWELPCGADAKTGSDPVPPPVVQVCPCWTPAEADAVDGVLSNGTTAAGWAPQTTSGLACSARADSPYIQEADDPYAPTEVSYIQAVNVISLYWSLRQCKYKTRVPNQPPVDVFLSVEFGTLTEEQHAACVADIVARQRALDICQ